MYRSSGKSFEKKKISKQQQTSSGTFMVWIIFIWLFGLQKFTHATGPPLDYVTFVRPRTGNPLVQWVCFKLFSGIRGVWKVFYNTSWVKNPLLYSPRPIATVNAMTISIKVFAIRSSSPILLIDLTFDCNLAV